MKLQYLGTAAAEGVPAIFCRCDICRYALEKGGKEIRTRAGSMLDDTLKIDFGPDSFCQMLKFGLDYTRLRSLLVTHSHHDHLAEADLYYRHPSYANFTEESTLTVYGNSRVGERLAPCLSKRLAFRELHTFETVSIEGYSVTPLEALHMVRHGDENPTEHVVHFRGVPYSRSEDAFIYLIEQDGKCLLYAHDNGGLTDENIRFLAGKHLDLVSMDCTHGTRSPSHAGHMGYLEDLEMRDTLIQTGCADGSTRFVAHHFSHNGLAPYERMQALLPGFTVSYDGMTIDF